MPTPPLKYRVSSTVSPEASAQMQSFFAHDPALIEPGDAPKSQTDWDALSARADAQKKPQSDAFAKKSGVTVASETLGGIAALRIAPHGGAAEASGLLIYVHGGGYVVFSASSELVLPTLLATEMHMDVVSIDYTRAPKADYHEVTDEIVAVYEALVDGGADPARIGIFGDSAGGGMTLAATLKLRDRGLPLPGALYLISPSTDISKDGDSRMTLADSDPIISASAFDMMANAYAPNGRLADPYASPVHGDFSKPFPPVLVQGGTREVLLSDFVRVYQALARNGRDVVLDLYEGMCHVFQARFPEVPETEAAVRRAGDFLRSKLALPPEVDGDGVTM